MLNNEGSFAHGLRNGEGTLTVEGDYQIKTNFIDGEAFGKGTYSSCNDNIIYEGNFVDGWLDGEVKVYEMKSIDDNRKLLETINFNKGEPESIKVK